MSKKNPKKSVKPVPVRPETPKEPPASEAVAAMEAMIAGARRRNPKLRDREEQQARRQELQKGQER